MAWERRPGNRVGGLLALVGFAWLAFTLSASNYSLSFTFGVVAGGVWGAALLHVLVAFPTGRLGGRGTRALVVAGYAVALLPGAGLLLSGAYRCAGCPPVLRWPTRTGSRTC